MDWAYLTKKREAYCIPKKGIRLEPTRKKKKGGEASRVMKAELKNANVSWEEAK